MKLCALLSLIALRAFAPTLPPSTFITWDFSPDPDVASYRFYRGPESGVYDEFQDVGRRHFLRIVGQNLIRFAVVTAVGIDGLESFPSNEIQVPSGEIFTEPKVTTGANSVTWEIWQSPWTLQQSSDLVT
jgi:hypothetical protein